MTEPFRQCIVAAVLGGLAVLILAACTSAAGPGWTFGPVAASAPGSSAPSAPTATGSAPLTAPAPSSPATASGSAPPASPTPSSAPSQPAPGAPSPATISFTPGTLAHPRVVRITADDFLNFNPGVIVAVEGETVKFVINDVGKAVHEFKIGPAADVIADKESAPEIPEIKPGTTASLTYTFKGGGPFAFACHAPGHFEHGMMGWISLVGPDVPTVGTTDHPRLMWIGMSDQLRFTPDIVAIAAGETVQFVLTNSGTIDHEFQVGPGEGVAADLVDGVTVQEVDKIDPGSTRSIVYTFSGTAPFAFACHEPGHYQAGMKGAITISGH